MSDARYRVVFSGEVEADATVDEVKAKLAKLFKMSDAQTEKLFGGGQKVIKKNAGLEICQKTQAAFQRAGAICTVEEENPPQDTPLAMENSESTAENTNEEATTSDPEPLQEEQFSCSGCGKMFSADDLIQYEGARICADCKPSFVQRLKEGAEVSQSALSGQYGSIEKALSGQVDFSIGGMIKEAWGLVKGSKLTIVGGVICMYIAAIGITMIMGVAMAMIMPIMAGSSQEMAIGITVGLQLLIQILMMAIMYPFMAGLFMIGIRKSVNLPTSFSMIFGYFNRTISLLIVNVLMTILVMIGFMLLVIPGIYLAVSYMLAMPLLVEKNMSPWKALETSRKAISKKWFKVFGLFSLLWLIVFLSMIPFGIGLIWTAPLGFITVGILYREMFGVESTS